MPDENILAGNTVLAQAEAEVMKRVQPAMRQNVDKVLTSILKVALNRGPQGLMSHLKEGDPIETVVRGSIAITSILRRQSTGTMPPQAMVAAAFIAVLHGLAFVEKAGIMKIGPTELDTATEMFADEIAKSAGLTPERVAEMTAQTQSVMGNSEQTAELQKNFGGADGPVE